MEIHLAQLKRDGLIEAWHDRRILAGSNLDDSINEQLQAADIVLLLVSPDFINSDYCYSREMALALERQARKEAHVLAVILRACDWTSSPLGKLLAFPTDARAVTSWPNQDEAFTDVAKAIRKVVNSLASKNAVAATTIRPAPVASAAAPAGASAVPAPEPLPRSSNLRLKKEFSDLDRDVFIKDSFDFMARFFEGSLQELEARHLISKVGLSELTRANLRPASTKAGRPSRNALSPSARSGGRLAESRTPTKSRLTRTATTKR
ncbi:toll/interleukin-1 receptor domain-containing protein [Caballeronia choica]|uniref:toll/interleukin-1 receptor domain-containing protein n=1 Tax=Caballeronia choica TaxID=326476 RepID=UPI00190E92B3|nr:toll/interleukin-1 receptor domain-containing protein [Caballeronia choica]